MPKRRKEAIRELNGTRSRGTFSSEKIVEKMYTGTISNAATRQTSAAPSKRAFFSLSLYLFSSTFHFSARASAIHRSSINANAARVSC